MIASRLCVKTERVNSVGIEPFYFIDRKKKRKIAKTNKSEMVYRHPEVFMHNYLHGSKLWNVAESHNFKRSVAVRGTARNRK